LPHLTLYALEDELAGREAALATALTDTVVSVYGDWARALVNIQLIGLPRGRWFVGGSPVASVAPTVTFRIRADAFERPDAPELMARLATGVRDAVAAVFSVTQREEITVELVPTRDWERASV
jgi:phenylpyruvate tautomerase PptA (4-oxalocrotonate tautomerase family)